MELNDSIPSSCRLSKRPVRLTAPARRFMAFLMGSIVLGWGPLVAGAEREVPLVLTQVPRQVNGPPRGWDAKGLLRSDWLGGARVVIAEPNRKLRVLSEGFESACDPDVSFDGQRVLFAGKRKGESAWRIWETRCDGSGLRAVTPEGLDARSPIHVSTLFTLDSPEPWLTLVFAGRTLDPTQAGGRGGAALYNVKLDGTELRRLTFNPHHQFDPFQMWDGRVIYAAETHPHAPGRPEGQVGLFAIHVEGADMELYGAERAQRIRAMPCATDEGAVVFVESTDASWDGAGQLACVEERRPHVTYRSITQDAAHRYLYPWPNGGHEILVSRRPAGRRGHAAVLRLDVETGAQQVVYDDPDFHDLQARPLRARRMPDGHSTVVNTAAKTGVFYGLDCYTTDALMGPHMTRGIVKRVRFIEGLADASVPAVKDKEARSWRGPHLPRRLIGEAPVEADGSFNVEVPADTPLLLQTLDERGLALATCGWIWVKPKETRGCIGCHEDPERIPENQYVLALRRPSNVLVLPPAQRRAVTFRKDVAPLFQNRCGASDCHGGTQKGLPLALKTDGQDLAALKKVYSQLMQPERGTSGTMAAGRYVDPGRARTSWLVWQLSGKDVSRPWDVSQGRSGREVALMPPEGKGKPLSAEELRTVIQWIDLGAPFDVLQPSASEATPPKRLNP